jgi:hypothetical protein
VPLTGVKTRQPLNQRHLADTSLNAVIENTWLGQRRVLGQSDSDLAFTHSLSVEPAA